MASGLGLIGVPTIVPASVLGKNAPSNRINIGIIGTGRIARVYGNMMMRASLRYVIWTHIV